MDSAYTRRRPAALLAVALAVTTGLAALAPPATGSTAREGTTSVTVVVRAVTGGVDAASRAVLRAGGTVGHRLPLVDGVSARLPAGTVLAPNLLVATNVAMQTARRDTTSDRGSQAVRAALDLGPAASQGAGVTIAVVDTGVNEHVDLKGRVEHTDVSGTFDGTRFDGYGHGTFVAGAAAGDGRSSEGRYAGVAPGARVLDVRVADDDGRTDLVTVLRGLEVASARGVDVVNLSMSSGSPLPYQLDPLTVALDRLWADGVVVVVPSGNDGDGGRGSVTSPGVDPVLLTVGALDDRATTAREDDVVAAFSGRGPAPQGVAKPDLVAPGRSLVSLRALGSTVDLAYPQAVVDAQHVRGSGTSFSTALVSGAAAVLLAQRADLRPDQVKALVTRTAYGTGRTRVDGLRDATAAGAGALDVAAALAARTPKVRDAVLDSPPPGEDEIWAQLVQDVIDGDVEAAASSWSRLSPAAHRWAASSWSASSWSAHRWAASSWSAHRWAAHRWAASSWSASSWSAHRWAAHRWAASSWSASSWSAHRWSGGQWYAGRWSANSWAATWE